MYCPSGDWWLLLAAIHSVAVGLPPLPPRDPLAVSEGVRHPDAENRVEYWTLDLQAML